jgi:phosphatidylglycerol:prolipoprotein diacylglycerol transferase
MVPYIHIPDLHIGPLPLHPFGILVATGVLVGTSITAKRATKLGYDVVQLNSFVTWMLVSAFILSHILDQFFYHWDEVVRRPWSVFMLWEGLSSFGGFIGAVVGIVLWKYFVIDEVWPRRRAQPAPLLPFADLVLSVLPVGWAFGRAGCASVHDHPGARATADTLLAVAYPRHPGDGTVTKFGFIELIQGHDPRFDLGFLEFLFTVFLAICFALTWRRKLPIGTYVIVTGLAYAPVRFAMDFLRIPATDGGDTRYGDLTPAQWSCIALFVYSFLMIFYVRRQQARGIDTTLPLREHRTDGPEDPPGGVKAPA